MIEHEQEKRETVLKVASALGVKIWLETNNPDCENCERCGYEIHKGDIQQCDECGLGNLCYICANPGNERGHSCGHN